MRKSTHFPAYRFENEQINFIRQIARAASILLAAVCIFLSAITPLQAQDGRDDIPDEISDEIPDAAIVNDEGGPVAIRGAVSYTNEFFTIGVAAPMIILEDQAGFVDRNEYYLFPVKSQTLGQITSDFYESPFNYSLALPIEPQGALRDVDNDDELDIGVMVFAIAYWTNTFGDPFLEERDLFGGGWSTAYASTRVSSDASNKREIVGGKMLVYAADAQQGFPSGYGDDGRLFTADDPIVMLPQGYTIVDLNRQVFVFDRSRYPMVDLIEPDNAATVNYSNLSYSRAFDAMIDKMSKEYAFTEYKGVDWDELADEFRPRFVSAEEDDDGVAYRRALRDFSFSIPDGHVSGPLLIDEFRQQTAGGIGLALRETDDGEVIANFVLNNGPADQMGIERGATILQIDGQDIQVAIDEVVPASSPFSTAHVKRLQQLRYLVRSRLSARREITFRNFGESRERTVTLRSIAEQDSFRFSSLQRGLTGFELPLEYTVLPSGYAYVQIYSFSDNELLTIQLWERLMRTLADQDISGLIIDMRQNAGGSGFLADQMAAYFFDKPHELGATSRYNAEIDDFYSDERGMDRFYLPATDLRYYDDLAVLIGPDCNSACEFFAYALTIDERASIIGQYPTAGLGGSIDLIIMPDGEQIRYTSGRALDPSGEIHIEGKGVAPTVKVPVTTDILLSNADVVLGAAIQHLDGQTPITIEEGGTVTVGIPIEDQPFAPGIRTQYNLTVEEDRTISIYLGDDTGAVDTVLRLYRENGELLLDNYDDVYEDAIVSSMTNLQLLAGTTVLIEASTFQDRGNGNYSLVVVDVSPESTAIPIPSTRVPSTRVPSTPLPPTPIPPTSTAIPPTSTPPTPIPPTLIPPTPVPPTPIPPTPVPPTPVPPISDPSIPDSSTLAPSEPLEFLGTALVTTSGPRLRVRAEPDPSSLVVGFVEKDSIYNVLAISRDGTWVRIYLPGSNQNNSGWVSIDFVSITVLDP